MGIPSIVSDASPAWCHCEGKLSLGTNRDKQGLGEITNLLPTNFSRHPLTRSDKTGTDAAATYISSPKEPAGEDIDKGEPSATPPYPFSADSPSLMYRHPFALHLNDILEDTPDNTLDDAIQNEAESSSRPPLEWDWTIEHEDRKRERKADMALRDSTPFEVDRKLLKDVVREKMGTEVGRIRFLSAGTFHKAYLVTLVNYDEVVARVARRFMPRLKVESEVATINFLRQHTNVPVPTIHYYDSNPYNRLGGEFILMSKAPGIPLAQVYHGMPHNDLVKLLKNLAAIIIPLFAQRFKQIGSLYLGPDPSTVTSAGTTPHASSFNHYSAFPFSPTLPLSTVASKFPSAVNTPKNSSLHVPTIQSLNPVYHVGPIISWPFFGSNRGELIHPHELNRGPWPTTDAYLSSCVEREIQGVIRESEGKSAPHRLHLDPDEIQSSRHHRLRAVPGDQSDDSDEWGLEESEDEWEGPGDAMYRDYRRMQRSTFLVAHMKQREQAVQKEMNRWRRLMGQLSEQLKPVDGIEEFGLDCHDLSLENVFVDSTDHTKITCIIDWESTTTRPLWACAHVPAALQTSPFVTKLFREVVANLPNDPTVNIELPKTGKPVDLATLCKEWLYYESAGMKLRMAHRCAEWDGWEEGLVESILGPEEIEHEWLTWGHVSTRNGKDDEEVGRSMIASPLPEKGAARPKGKSKVVAAAPKAKPKLPLMEEREKEQMLNTTGDFCGGRGGELGRRLEAWLVVNGENSPKWADDSEMTSPLVG